MKMRDLKQTYIIFTASDTVYCTAESYDLANEIIEADGLIDAIIQQVNHITSIEAVSYTHLTLPTIYSV